MVRGWGNTGWVIDVIIDVIPCNAFVVLARRSKTAEEARTVTRNGTVRATVNVRYMFGQIQKPEIAAMSTFVLHGTVYGRFGGLRSKTGTYYITLGVCRFFF